MKRLIFLTIITFCFAVSIQAQTKDTVKVENKANVSSSEILKFTQVEVSNTRINYEPQKFDVYIAKQGKKTYFAFDFQGFKVIDQSAGLVSQVQGGKFIVNTSGKNRDIDTQGLVPFPKDATSIQVKSLKTGYDVEASWLKTSVSFTVKE